MCYHDTLNAEADMRIQLPSVKPEIKKVDEKVNNAILLMESFSFVGLF